MKACTAPDCPGNSPYNCKGLCRACYLRAFRAKHPGKTREYNQRNRARNGDHIRAYDRERRHLPHRQALHREVYANWREKNLEADRAQKRRYYRENKDKATLRKALRNSRMKQATPKWLTAEMVQQIADAYTFRPRGYHVDHIVPLKGKNVCGLNVPWNLQYLLAEDNLKKGNKC